MSREYADFLAGDGEIRARLRALDGSWPAALRTALAICLDSPHPLWLAWGPRREILYNDAFATILGGVGSLGVPACDVFSDSWSVLGPVLDGVLATGRGATLELEVPARRPITCALGPIHGVGAVFAVVEEPTARSVARQHLNALFAHSPVALLVTTGADHHIEIANAAVERLTDRAITIGRTIEETFPDADVGRSVHDRVFRDGHLFSTDELHVMLDRHGRRAEAIFSVTMVPIHDGPGTVTGVMTTGVEITEQVLARRALEESEARERQARTEAEQANRAKDEFLAMLGHELRNPLAPIVTALQLMRLRGDDTVERERAVIERQTQHLIQLVDALLDISRITRGKVELKRKRIELAPIVSRAIEMASPLVEQRRHDLEVDVPKHGLLIDADPERMAQVVANLLTNAAKYTESGGRIELRARPIDHEIEIVVSDTGIGIGPEMLPRVFDMFVQEHQSLDRSRGGLGLGLSIVRSLVRLHGGTVAVASGGRGRGSTFTIRLPGVGEGVAATEDEIGVVPRKEGTRILVVDDNEDAAQLLAEALEAVGNTTQVAYDGPAALRIAEKFHPELALLDIGLPVMDGYELAHRLREQASDRPIHLVAITGYSQEADRQRSREAGFDAHLVKPLDLERLLRVVADLGHAAPA